MSLRISASIFTILLCLTIILSCSTSTEPDTDDSALPASIAVEPTFLHFDSTTTSLHFTIINTGEQTLTWQVEEDLSWLSVTADCGECNAETDTVTVTVNRTGISPGAHTDSLTISSNGGEARVIVTMAVADPPVLHVEPTSLEFELLWTQQVLSISNVGGGTLTWQCDGEREFLSSDPSSGSTTTEVDEVTVFADRTGLAPDDYTDTLTVTSNGGTMMVPVSVSVGIPPSLVGDYIGVYLYITGYGTASEQTDEYSIEWRFADQEYWMWNAAGSEGELCEPSGEYRFTYGVELLQHDEGCDGSGADPELNPAGVFSLRLPSDSVVMTRIDGDVCREIRLTPYVMETPILRVTPVELDFGPCQMEKIVSVTNTGNGTLTWTIECSEDWITTDSAGGATTSETDNITVIVDRTGLALGDYDGSVSVLSNGGTASVSVLMIVGGDGYPLYTDWEGEYHFSTGYGTVEEQTSVYPIFWRFTDEGYRMWNCGDAGELCKPSGTYPPVTSTINLIQDDEGCTGEDAEPERNPTGIFDLTNRNDSLIMTQISSDTCKELLLVRVLADGR